MKKSQKMEYKISFFEIYYFSDIYFFTFIKIAIASKINKIPITISKIFKIYVKPNSESDALFKLLTVVDVGSGVPV